ncbi:hypothetical protein AUEXF2481DRAFT_88976 [Aureobasidium subglaciale EXF-2481]|uniref:Uncharacterized protein n=1 Tax=Aureobasidium subglaciale (strain EXF-2481) TaxID=1043005 RepID=A0A074YAU7_AURSE|nr:uncharacterized protein AUEXF2481DRAFT_88976 [Aureobasidium subglaciale EXF-2481]KEQ94895.1 hypothetical protein AUEXF2481DRAFT_88976 [Aureobasidium subglaciale EXF-2481]
MTPSLVSRSTRQAPNGHISKQSDFQRTTLCQGKQQTRTLLSAPSTTIASSGTLTTSIQNSLPLSKISFLPNHQPSRTRPEWPTQIPSISTPEPTQTYLVLGATIQVSKTSTSATQTSLQVMAMRAIGPRSILASQMPCSLSFSVPRTTSVMILWHSGVGNPSSSRVNLPRVTLCSRRAI